MAALEKGRHRDQAQRLDNWHTPLLPDSYACFHGNQWYARLPDTLMHAHTPAAQKGLQQELSTQHALQDTPQQKRAHGRMSELFVICVNPSNQLCAQVSMTGNNSCSSTQDALQSQIDKASAPGLSSQLCRA
jgi:hypothetical protein